MTQKKQNHLKMSFVIEATLLSNMDTLLRYQNNLLIRKIAEEKKWPLAELKKFLPKKQKIKLDQETEVEPVKTSKSKKKQEEPNFKVIKKKVIRKKIIKKVKVPKTEEAKNILTKLKKEGSKPKKIVKSSKPRRKIVKKIVNAEAVKNTVPKSTVEEIPVVEDNTLTEEIDMLEVQCISYQEKEYFLDLKTDKVYKLNEDDLLVFVGMLEGKQVNFDAESAED